MITERIEIAKGPEHRDLADRTIQTERLDLAAAIDAEFMGFDQWIEIHSADCRRWNGEVEL